MRNLFQVLKVRLLAANSLKYSLLFALFVFCQSVWSWSDAYSGSAWDEVVSESNRPTGITTNQQGNYVITLTNAKHLAWYAWKLRTETNSSELKKYSYADVKLGADIVCQVIHGVALVR